MNSLERKIADLCVKYGTPCPELHEKNWYPKVIALLDLMDSKIEEASIEKGAVAMSEFDNFKGNLECQVQRAASHMGYDLTLLSRQGERLYLARLRNLEFKGIERGEAVLRKDYDMEIQGESLRTLYLSLQEELIREGLLPRPLAPDQVVMLKEQLRDTQKVRDDLLKVVQTTAHYFAGMTPSAPEAQ